MVLLPTETVMIMVCLPACLCQRANRENLPLHARSRSSGSLVRSVMKVPSRSCSVFILNRIIKSCSSTERALSLTPLRWGRNDLMSSSHLFYWLHALLLCSPLIEFAVDRDSSTCTGFGANSIVISQAGCCWGTPTNSHSHCNSNDWSVTRFARNHTFPDFVLAGKPLAQETTDLIKFTTIIVARY